MAYLLYEKGYKRVFPKGISHPVFLGDLVNKLRRIKDTQNFISSGSKIVKSIRRRHHDPLIIDRTIGIVLGPSTALYRHARTDDIHVSVIRNMT